VTDQSDGANPKAGEFVGRTVVITGAASGMGAATAREFTRLGAAVVVVDRDADRASVIAQEIGAAAVFIGDVSDSAFCDRVMDDVATTHGQIDVLVNCAGVILRADGPDTDDEGWHRVMRVNVDGVFFMSRAAVTHMISRRSGAIVNFGSIWGGVGAAGVLAYCASKGAVHQITRAMALDHAMDGIRINAVAPGEVDTPMLASGRESRPSAATLQRLADATIPLKRLARPEEIARVVVFLASDAASYMTGSIVPVDAGYTAR